ncbi:hypothetical protein [Actinokineospora iranica]|uniref:hypothetical protein n=1 Tax=Actinokineospora iranica TaxID=1271860 RepID=UPI001114595A|nr:hypothetical protein [Actinokineospora iranica]
MRPLQTWIDAGEVTWDAVVTGQADPALTAVALRAMAGSGTPSSAPTILDLLLSLPTSRRGRGWTLIVLGPIGAAPAAAAGPLVGADWRHPADGGGGELRPAAVSGVTDHGGTGSPDAGRRGGGVVADGSR